MAGKGRFPQLGTWGICSLSQLGSWSPPFTPASSAAKPCPLHRLRRFWVLKGQVGPLLVGPLKLQGRFLMLLDAQRCCFTRTERESYVVRTGLCRVSRDFHFSLFTPWIALSTSVMACDPCRPGEWGTPGLPEVLPAASSPCQSW